MNKLLTRLINMNFSNNHKIMIVTSYSGSLGGIIILSLENVKNNKLFYKKL
jgi:hypothetical protein